MHADVITQLKVHLCRLKSLIFSDIWWKCFWVKFDKDILLTARATIFWNISQQI
jgi:hypothetical protein